MGIITSGGFSQEIYDIFFINTLSLIACVDFEELQLCYEAQKENS